jgi:hypothetical protein
MSFADSVNRVHIDMWTLNRPDIEKIRFGGSAESMRGDKNNWKVRAGKNMMA